MSEFTNDDKLALLREVQDSELALDRQTFSEWRATGGMERDIDRLMKAGGGHISPGFGMMGRAGSMGTNSFAPTGPSGRRSGNQGVGFGGSQGTRRWDTQQFGLNGAPEPQSRSKYDFDRPDQPPPYIDDVNMANIWYSPMEPVWPFGPPFYDRPREWNFPVGYNLNFITGRQELMGTLRGMRQSWGVLGTIIETRKDQLLRLPWTIQRKDKPRQGSKAVDEVRKFFRRPDGKMTYNQWSRRLLDDLFVIDAPTIFKNRLRGGKLYQAEILDGATIFPLIDDAGRRPDTAYEINPDGSIDYLRRQPAYQQITYGLPMINLSEDEIIYAMMRPLPELPVFGFSPVQQIMIEATEAIRKTFYQLEFWRSGSMPELIVTVPNEWTPRQIAMFQGHFDALLSGQLSLKSKVRFVPGGMKPFDIKNASGQSLWSDRDEMLVRLACYAFSVSPTPFVKQTNRGTANNQQQTAQEEGLYPLMSYWKDDIMDRIIQEGFGYDDIEMVFLPRPEVDLEKQAKIHQIKVNNAQMTINEARAENGEEPYPSELGDTPLIIFGGAAVRLEDVISGKAVMPGTGQQGGETGNGPKSPQKPEASASNPLRGTATSRVSSMPEPTPVHKAHVTRGDVRRAAKEANTDPTKHQKHVGNYRKGHIIVQGLNISIENSKGSKRNGKDANGDKWKVKMPAAYGYIRGFIGADDEHMDVYIGKHPMSPMVYVIDQNEFADGKSSGFDEHKCMVGYKSPHKAVKDYLKSHFDGQGLDRLVAVTAMSMVEFKRWLAKGDLHKPCAGQGFGSVIEKDSIAKADTISAGTGLAWYDQTTAVPRKKKRHRFITL